MNSFSRYIDRPAVHYRQLCAIAREQVLAAPTISDGEWADRIKDRLAALGFACPRPDQIASATSSVSHALAKTLGPRHVQSSMRPKDQAPAPVELPSKPTPAEWARMASLLRNLTPKAVAGQQAPPARETLTVSEPEVLARFYRAAETDRLQALKDFAELAILRDAEWDPEAIRAAHEATRPSMSGQRCFACLSGSRPMDWHHVIQIQHGGSNAARNRLPLCAVCHAVVHPWLPARTTTDGWTRVGDIGGADLDWLPQPANVTA